MKPLTAAQRANLRILESDLPRRTVTGHVGPSRQGQRSHITPFTRRQANELRKAGYTLKAIADATGTSPRTVVRLVKHRPKRKGANGKRG